ncbi:MAG TPA: PQQ-binding-like beta-propeller repeat protein [Candidatus Saccharimonadales bacterium]|nr:PQQ-binding-like beta-propeller repeat protein [Candidatus Saccharimonadales bacterium]
MKWKTPIHGKAWSSPVIWGEQVWLTTATPDGKELSVVCVDTASGKVVRDQKLFEVEKPQFCIPFNSYASPTPVIEEGRLYATFGSPGTACVDTRTGKVLWERRDFVCNHFRSAGSSPILYNGLLIMNFDGSDHQFIVALDKKDGRTLWRTERSIDYKDLGNDGKPQADGDYRKAFSTPHVSMVEGKPMLISSGAKATYGYEPMSGKELWRVEERTSHSASTRPVLGHGLVYVLTGWSNGQLLAIRPGKPGSVVDANAVSTNGTQAADQLTIAWKQKRGVPKKPSLLLVDNFLFMVDDGGFASCVDAKTGTEYWRERIAGSYSAAPVYGAGRIYFCSEEGKTSVVAAAKDFKLLTENKLDDGFLASPAISGKALYLRTKTNLYRIEE